MPALAQDKLDFDAINALAQPLLARFYSDRDPWPVIDVEVQTALVRIDVVGKSEVKRFAEVAEIVDGDGKSHDPDQFYLD